MNPPFILKVLCRVPIYAAGVLVFVRPFLDGVWRDVALAAMVGLLVFGVGLAILYHRLTTGRWTRPVTPQERQEVRQRAVSDQIGMVLWLIPMSIVGLPIALKLKSLGWGKNATIMVSLLVAAAVSAVVLFVLRRWAKSIAAKKAGGPLSPT